MAEQDMWVFSKKTMLLYKYRSNTHSTDAAYILFKSPDPIAKRPQVQVTAYYGLKKKKGNMRE